MICHGWHNGNSKTVLGCCTWLFDGATQLIDNRISPAFIKKAVQRSEEVILRMKINSNYSPNQSQICHQRKETQMPTLSPSSDMVSPGLVYAALSA
jgi:hypothetical protein